MRLDEVVLRALEHKPELRYQQASVLKTAVDTLAETVAGHAAVPPAPDPTEKAKSQIVRIVEILFGIPLTSPLAVKLVNISALGFLGSLGFLGYVRWDGR